MTRDERRPDAVPEDDRLTALLSCVRADAEPAVWTRVRARLEARGRERAGGWLAWLARPVALGASLAVFVLATAVSALLVAGAPRALPLGQADNLTDALVTDLREGAMDASRAGPGASPATTPERATPADSGEHAGTEGG
jgi:hypothetical protein